MTGRPTVYDRRYLTVETTPAPPGRWVDQAACRGKQPLFVMYPTASHKQPTHSRHRPQIEAAKQICASCPVLIDCYQWAMTDPDPAFDLIAGGLTPRERVIRRRNRHR